MSEPIHERASRWAFSHRISTEGCAERLAAIKNEFVSESAQSAELRRMADEIEILRYIELALSEKETESLTGICNESRPVFISKADQQQTK